MPEAVRGTAVAAAVRASDAMVAWAFGLAVARSRPVVRELALAPSREAQRVQALVVDGPGAGFRA